MCALEKRDNRQRRKAASIIARSLALKCAFTLVAPFLILFVFSDTPSPTGGGGVRVRRFGFVMTGAGAPTFRKKAVENGVSRRYLFLRFRLSSDSDEAFLIANTGWAYGPVAEVHRWQIGPWLIQLLGLPKQETVVLCSRHRPLQGVSHLWTQECPGRDR